MRQPFLDIHDYRQFPEFSAAARDIFCSKEMMETISAVTGDPVKFAGYRAMGETAKRFGEAVSARLNEITPAIHVANGRKVTVAFISGVTLDGMEVDDALDAPHPYRGLDGRR